MNGRVHKGRFQDRYINVNNGVVPRLGYLQHNSITWFLSQFTCMYVKGYLSVILWHQFIFFSKNIYEYINRLSTRSVSLLSRFDIINKGELRPRGPESNVRKLANSDIEYHSYSLPLILKVRTHYRAMVGSVGAASLGVKE